MSEQTKANIDLSSPPASGGHRAEFLFVYGTLRRDFHRKVVELPENDFIYFGEGQVSASLYDLGTYPAAVKDKSVYSITGDVFKISDAATVFAILDEYEGEEYQRERTTITLASGDLVEAWMYWYAGTIDTATEITNGDYLAYLQTTSH